MNLLWTRLLIETKLQRSMIILYSSFYFQWGFLFLNSDFVLLTVTLLFAFISWLSSTANSSDQYKKQTKKYPFTRPGPNSWHTKFPSSFIFFFSGAFGDQMWGRWDYLSFIFQVFRNRTLNWWSVVNVNCSVKRFGCYYVSAESLLCPWNPYSEPLFMRLILRFFSVKVCTEVSL